MSKKRRPESSYYETVRQYLKSQGCVVESYRRNGQIRPFIGRGHDRLIVDVYGLRGFDATASRTLEGIAVEVKRSKKRTSLRYMVQARQYSRLAHRCYLAQPREFDLKTKIEASKLGIGLLRIKGNKVEAVAESAPFTPEPDLFHLFVHRSLEVVRCSLCHCYRFQHGGKSISYGTNGSVRSHKVRDDVVAGVQGERVSKLNKKMYICDRCEDLIKRLSGANQLQVNVNGLDKRIRKLSAKLRKK